MHVSFPITVSFCGCMYLSRNGISGSIFSFLRNLQTWWLSSKESVYSAGDCVQYRIPEFSPWIGKTPWRKKWQPIPVFLPGESHGRRSLVGYSPRGRKESDTTERLHSLHFTSFLSLEDLSVFLSNWQYNSEEKRKIGEIQQSVLEKIGPQEVEWVLAAMERKQKQAKS